MEALDIRRLYKEIRIHHFTHAFFFSAHPFSSSSAQASILSASKKHSDHVRIWSAGQVDGLLHHREGNHEAPRGGVLGPGNRPPAYGQGEIVPTPEPHERVVFIPHFVRGLGFPLHPFVCGLMFYYGLDFHDLAPISFLNISAFIVVCEAFLHIPPHFGLWLKTFNVKPKVVGVNTQSAEALW